MSDDHKKEIDEVTGVETTGHEWDGLKELNNPSPRWWLWVFFATVVWAVGYWVLYPAWPVPGGATQGMGGQTQLEELAHSQAKIGALQEAYIGSFRKATLDDVMNNPELYTFAVAGGRAAFKDNCAVCHGTGGTGGKGYPNLNDDDWLWGGDIDSIYQTLQYGIRSGHDEARMSQMPSFGRDGLLKREEIVQVVSYVESLSQGKASASDPGHQIFQTNCASCHGEDGKGLRDFGAPNLTDSIWLYGGEREAIYNSVYNAHAGVMPYWKGRLPEDVIRQLAVYVHSLGGGETKPATSVERVMDATSTDGASSEAP